MQLQGSVALVTGANRGLGLAYARALRDAGAKVYAGARDPQSVPAGEGLIAVALDVTDAEQVRAVAAELTDVSIVVNNAGIGGATTALRTSLESARELMEVNYVGTLSVAQAFAPVLAANGGGALVNMLSALSWMAFPQTSTYSASKSAAWAITNALRVELRGQGTLVTAIHVGYVDTDMTAGVEAPKSTPEDIAAQLVTALQADEEELLADDVSRTLKANLSAAPRDLYADVQAGYDAAVAAAA